MTTVSATRSDYFRCLHPQLRQGHLLSKGFHTDADKESRVQKNRQKMITIKLSIGHDLYCCNPSLFDFKLIWQCTVHFSLCTKINVKIFEGFLANDHPDQIKGAAKDYLRLSKGIMSMKIIYRTFIKKLDFVFSVFHFYCFRDFAEAFNKALDFRYKVAVLQTSRTNPQMWNLKKILAFSRISSKRLAWFWITQNCSGQP